MRYPSIRLMLGLAIAAMLPGARAHAQAQASVEFEVLPLAAATGRAGAPGATGLDSHPTTYKFSGETRPVKDPAEYFTFYYTGKVLADATVDKDVPIQRIAIPLSQWDVNKDAIISGLMGQLGGLLGNLPGPEAQRAQQTVKLDENFRYVDVPKQAPPPGAPANARSFDPKALAEWTFYYDQFVLWQFYCRRVVLNDTDATRANSAADAIQLGGDIERLKATGLKGEILQRAIDEVARSRQPAATTALPAPAGARGPGGNRAGQPAGARPPAARGGGGMNMGGTAGASRAAAPRPAAPRPGGASRGGGNQLPQALQEKPPEAATHFTPEIDFLDPTNNDKYHEEFDRLGRSKEQEVTRIYSEMIQRISHRKDSRDAYANWIGDQQKRLVAFAEAWGRVRAGERVSFDDTFYLITKEPLDMVPLESRNIVVREVVTPQDLIERDGNFRGQKANQNGAAAVAPAPAAAPVSIPPPPEPKAPSGQ